jgi:quercetin dioxygenase-like cupin family protein
MTDHDRKVGEPMNPPNVEDPGLCIVRARSGERVPPALAERLDPVDPATFHEYVLPAGTPVELHRHDYDEYWWFTSGEPTVTLWTVRSGAKEYALQPGDMVACVRGVAHTLRAETDLVYFQFSSVKRPGAREGHLPVEEPELSAATDGESA